VRLNMLCAKRFQSFAPTDHKGRVMKSLESGTACGAGMPRGQPIAAVALAVDASDDTRKLG
jgi:hypothetical protein